MKLILRLKMQGIWFILRDISGVSEKSLKNMFIERIEPPKAY